MSSSTVSISITAKDGTKGTFDAIKRGADQDAAALKAMGAAGSSSGQQVAAGAKAGESALKSQSAAINNLKIGAAALAAGFAVAARSSLDQQRSIDALMRSYGTAGSEIVKFTNAIEDQSNFSDEAARSAAAYGATLVNQYGLSVEQVEQLLTRAGDLAERTGTSFADAAERVTAAIRGEAESAEVFGIAAGDHALHLDQMAASTTDAERAQLRFNAVMDQSASAAGTAQRASEGVRGTIIDLAQSAGDAAQAFAAWTGPVGQAVAGLSNYALQAGIAIGGVSKLVSGIQALTAAQEVNAAVSAEATVAGAGLSAVLGPVGIVLAAGAAAVAIYELTKGHDDESAAAEAATKATTDLVTTLHDLAAAGNANAATGTAWLDALNAGLAEAAVQIDALKAKQTDLTGTDEPTAIGSDDTKVAALEKQIEALQSATEHATDAEIALNDILNDTGSGADLARQAAADLYNQFKQTGDVAALVTGLIEIDSHLGDFDVTANQAAASAAKLSPAIDALGSAIGDLSAVKLSPELLADIETIKTLGGTDAKMALQSYFDTFKRTGDMDAFAASVDGVSDRLKAQAASAEHAAAINSTVADSAAKAASGVGKLGHAFEETDEQIAAATQATLDHATANNRWGPQIAAATEAQRLQREELDATVASLHQYGEALGSAGSFAAQLRPVDLAPKGGDKATGTAADLQRVGSALDSVLGTFKQLDSLGQAADQAGSIAQNLIGDPGELAAIDRLLTQGRISQTAYNNALEAGNDIRKESGAIENDLNTIRAKQLPILADADRQYGNLIDKISKMDASTQQVTLGFMDANEAMKAQNALALVSAASMGDLGASGKQATQDILQGATDADPVLKEMLKSIGLITEDKEGNIKINFENGAEVKATLDDVVSAIDEIAMAIDLLDGKADLDITIKAQADQAKQEAADTKKAIDDIPPEHNTDITETGSDSTRSAIFDTTGAVNGIPDSHNTDITQAGAEETQGAATNTTSAVNNIPFLHNVDITASDSASGVIENVRNLLTSTDGMSATTYINTVYQQVGAPGGGTAVGPGGAHGLLVGPEKSMVGGGMAVRVNEGGQEMVTLPTGDDVWLPTGSMVTPSAASKYGRGRGETGRPVNFYGTVNVYTSNPDDFIRQMQSYGVAGR